MLSGHRHDYGAVERDGGGDVKTSSSAPYNQREFVPPSATLIQPQRSRFAYLVAILLSLAGLVILVVQKQGGGVQSAPSLFLYEKGETWNWCGFQGVPTCSPTPKPIAPTHYPSARPTNPTAKPSARPTPSPTPKPTSTPTYIKGAPTPSPTSVSTTARPTVHPTPKPTPKPTPTPTAKPSARPTPSPTPKPTSTPTYIKGAPTPSPTSRTPWPTPSPTSNPTPSPTITMAPTSFAYSACNAVGPSVCNAFNLLAVSASGYVYAGFKGQILTPDQDRTQATATGIIYRSFDEGNSFSKLTEAYSDGIPYCGSTKHQKGSGLGGMSAGEDSTYSYLWSACNPSWEKIFEGMYQDYVTKKREPRYRNAGYVMVNICRTTLQGSRKTTCFQQKIGQESYNSRFTTVRAVSGSSDGSTAAFVGSEGGLLICTKDSGFTTITCNYKSDGRFASVAFDSTGYNIIAAPDTGYYLKYGRVSDADFTWTSTSKLSGPSGVAASWSVCIASDSFSKLVCAQYGGFTYASTDSGATWTASSSTNFFTSLSMTASGSTILAGSAYETPYIALSSDGLTWEDQQGCQSQLPTNAVAIISKKSYFSARAVPIKARWDWSGGSDFFYYYGRRVYYYNYCYTDSRYVPPKGNLNGYWIIDNYMGVKSLYKSSTSYTSSESDDESDDDTGTITISAAEYENSFTVNTTSDFVWSELSGSRSASYSNSAVSSDGTVIVGAIGEGGLDISVDAGESWTLSTAAGKHVDWSDVITSSDGSHIFAVTHGGSVYVSSDYGVNLTEASVPVEDDFISVKCSR